MLERLAGHIVKYCFHIAASEDLLSLQEKFSAPQF